MSIYRGLHVFFLYPSLSLKHFLGFFCWIPAGLSTGPFLHSFAFFFELTHQRRGTHLTEQTPVERNTVITSDAIPSAPSTIAHSTA